MHSTYVNVFMIFCHQNKVWYWVLLDIPPLLEVLETATLGNGHPIHQHAQRLVLVNPGQVYSLRNTTISVGMETFYTLFTVE